MLTTVFIWAEVNIKLQINYVVYVHARARATRDSRRCMIDLLTQQDVGTEWRTAKRRFLYTHVWLCCMILSAFTHFFLFTLIYIIKPHIKTCYIILIFSVIRITDVSINLLMYTNKLITISIFLYYTNEQVRCRPT